MAAVFVGDKSSDDGSANGCGVMAVSSLGGVLGALSGAVAQKGPRSLRCSAARNSNLLIRSLEHSEVKGSTRRLGAPLRYSREKTG